MVRQYGAIPFIREGKEFKVVLVSGAGGRWIFPKGNLESHLGKRKTAALEAYEEAGVEGRLLKGVSYRARMELGNGDKVRVKLYQLEVEAILEKWPEMDRRKRKIIGVDKALTLIESKSLRKCLQRLMRDLVA